MIPVMMQSKHDPENGVYGDCMRACIASILELPPESVPHFEDNEKTGYEIDMQYLDWALANGYLFFVLRYDGCPLDHMGENNPGMFYILGGISRRGCGHAVVCKDNQIVHDPSPQKTGIVGPFDDGIHEVIIVAVDPQKKGC